MSTQDDKRAGLPDPVLVERTKTAAELRAQVARSITSGAFDGRTVEDPDQAAVYVVNMLTVHRLDLLAKLAVTFAEPWVRDLLEAGNDF